jgi:uncharacterized protein
MSCWHRIEAIGAVGRRRSPRQLRRIDGLSLSVFVFVQKGVDMHTETNLGTKNRGFASMDTHRQREIARKGGRAAHEKGKAHEFTSDEARAAGRKGGEKVSVNRSHMAEIGRRGGKSSAQRRKPEMADEGTTQSAAAPEAESANPDSAAPIQRRLNPDGENA